MRIFNVHAYRFGDRERHSYLVGVYSTSAKAKRAAKREETMRGGNKYKCEIIEIELDNKTNRSVLQELPRPSVKTSCTSKIHFTAMTKPLGTPLPVPIFKELGSNSAVSRALTRLVKQDIFIRKARGVYYLIGKGWSVQAKREYPKIENFYIWRSILQTRVATWSFESNAAPRLWALLVQEFKAVDQINGSPYIKETARSKRGL